MVVSLIVAVIAVAASAGVYYQQKRMEAQAKKQAQEAKAVQVSGHDSNRGLYTVYGTALVGSTVVWKTVTPKEARMTQSGFTTLSRATTAQVENNKDHGPNRFLYRAVTLCNGPITSVTNVTVDDEGYMSPRFGGHSLHFATTYSKGPAAGQNFSALRTAYPTAFASWGSTAVGNGVAYAVERLFLDPDNSAYQGEPQTRYRIQGRALYDPRKDSTSSAYDSSLGTSTHRAATATTWEYSANPVLALLDYLLNEEYGRGLDISTIDIDSIASSADKCDVLVDIPARLTNQTGSDETQYDPETGITYVTTPLGNIAIYRPDQVSTGSEANKQKRFSINLALDPSKEVLDNIQEILNVFRGNLSYANGKYFVHMADVASPVLTLGDDDIIGGLKVANGDRSQRMNRATIKFINENKQSKTDQVSWPSLDSNEDGGRYATYLAEDEDEKLHRTFTIKGCTDYYQAQDTAEYLVRDSRSNLTVSGTFSSRCFGLVPGDVIALTYDSSGFSGKYFRVIQTSVDLLKMTVQLQLKEYDSSVYTWNASRANEPIGLSWHEEVVNAVPTSLTIGTIVTNTRTQADGSSALTLTVPFTNVPESAQYVEVSWAINGTTEYNTQLVFDTENQTQVEIAIDRDNQTYAVRLRYFITNSYGTLMPSAYSTTTHAVSSLTGTKLAGIETGATANTGALADLDTVDTAQIDDEAITIAKIDTALQSTNYNAGTAGWKLTKAGVFEAGNGTFRGAVTATSGTFDGTVNASAGAFTGDVSTDSKFIAGTGDATTVIDGEASATYRIFSGAAQTESENAPFQVKPDGSVFAKNITVFDSSGNILLDQDGLGAAALAGISLTSGTAVDKVSGVLSGDGGEMTLTLDQTATVTLETKFAIYDNSVGTLYLRGTGASSSAALSDITNSTLNIIYSLQTDGGSYSTAATKPITFTSTDSTPSSTEVYVTAALISGSYLTILVDAGGALEYIANTSTYGATAYVVTSHTFTNLAAGVHKIKLSSTITGSGSPDAAGQSTSNRLYELTSSAINFVESAANVFANGSPSVPSGGGTVSGNLIISGDLTVNGTTTTLNTQTLDVEDKNITVNYGAGDTSASADGAGFTIQDAVNSTTDATLLWKTATDTFEFSHPIKAKSDLTLSSAGGDAGIYWKDSSASDATAWHLHADVTQATSNMYLNYAGGGTNFSFVNNGNFLAPGTIFADGAASNSLQWEAGYDYSQVGHLPLTGGTLTGAVTSTGLTVDGTGSAIELSQSTTGSATYYTMDNTVETGGKRWRFGYSGGSSDKGSFSFYNQTDSNLALLLASSGATFSGSVTADSLTVDTSTVSASPSARFRRNHGGQAYQQLSGLSFYWNTSNGGHDNTIVYGASANSSLKFTQATGSAFNDTLTINSSGNATFSGSVSSTGFRFGNTSVGTEDDSEYLMSTGGQLIIRANDSADDASYTNLILDSGKSGGTETNSAGVVTRTNNVNRMRVDGLGGISFFEDTGTTAKLVWSPTSEELQFADNAKAIFGAGSDLQIYHSGTHSFISDQGTGNMLVLADNFEINSASNTANKITATTSGAVTLFHNNAAKLATSSSGIDVTGSVTADGLTVDKTGGNIAASFISDDSNNSYVQFQNATTGTTTYTDGSLVGIDSDESLTIWQLESNHIKFGTAATERMRIDSSGSVGIGTGTPSAVLTTQTTGALTLDSNDGDHSAFGLLVYLPTSRANTVSGAIGFSGAGGRKYAAIGAQTYADTDQTGLNFYVQPSASGSTAAMVEAMRIDLSGDLIVGGTSSGANDAVSISNTGYIQAIVNGDTVGYFNRRTSDGEILRFQKDGTSVGSLGVNATRPYIASSAMGLKIAGSEIHSTSATGVSTDATYNLGSSLFRWKDLYLSGTIALTTADNASAANMFVSPSTDFLYLEHPANGMIFRNTSGAERMRIDASGTTTFTKSGGGNIRIAETASRYVEIMGYAEGSANGSTMAFHTIQSGTSTSTERARLTHDGSLLVGKTSSNVGTAGHEFLNYGRSIHTVNASTVQIINRLSNDGDLTIWQKNGTTVGSIGNSGTTAMYVGSGDTQLLFKADEDQMVPFSAGGYRDGAISLGRSNGRFKDLYLSGNIITSGNSFTATTSGYFFGGAGSYANGIYGVGVNNVAINANGSERARITSDGKFGLGTASPSAKLDVQTGNAGSAIRLSATDGSSGASYKATTASGNFYAGIDTSSGGSFGAANSAVLWYDANQPMIFATNNSRKMTLAADGNVGIGVVPSASYYTSLEIGNSGSSITGRGAADTHFMSGLFWDAGSTYKYSVSSVAVGSYQITNGIHYWATAPAGTAGNAATPQTNMVLDASGNVGISVTPSAFVLPDGSTGALQLQSGGMVSAYAGVTHVSQNWYYNSGEKYIANGSASRLVMSGADYIWQSAGNNTSGAGAALTWSESMRLSGGTLLAGTTTVNGEGITLSGNNNYGYFSRSGDAALFVNRAGTDGDALGFRRGGAGVGSISVNGSGTFYNTSSDQRLKDKIVDAPSASDDIDAIRVRSFDWKADGSHQKYGMIAQELIEVAPEAVSATEDADEMMGVDYSKLVPMLIKEIQQLRKRVKHLEEE